MSRREPDGPPPGPETLTVQHVCQLPRWVVRALVVLAVLVALLVAGLVLGAVYVYQANQYVQGRGEYRDREALALEQLMRELDRQAACDLLDQFPQGGWLDRPRAKYGCGPGIPIDDLPPDEAERLRQQRGGPTPVPVPAGPSSPTTATTTPEQPQAAPAPPPASEPAPATEPPPVIDLGPVTAMICDSVRVCF